MTPKTMTMDAAITVVVAGPGAEDCWEFIGDDEWVWSGGLWFLLELGAGGPSYETY